MKIKYIFLPVFAALLVGLYYCHCKPEKTRSHFGNFWLDSFKKYASDSLDLKKMLGDTFAIAYHHPQRGGIRSGKFLLLLNQVKNGDIVHNYFNVEDSIVHYFAIVDIEKKTLLKKYRLAQKTEGAKIVYPLLDYYNDTLYISCFQNSSNVLIIDTKTDKQFFRTIDPCNGGSGTEHVVRSGNNYYLLRRPYSAGVINWNTGECVLKQPVGVGENSGSYNWIAEPVSDGINLICTGAQKNGKTFHYEAFDEYGKSKWKHLSPNYISSYRDVYLDVDENYVSILEKETGFIKKKIKIDSIGSYKPYTTTKDGLWCSKALKDSVAGCCYTYYYYEFKFINIEKGSVQVSKKIGPINGPMTLLNNYLIADCHVPDSLSTALTKKIIQKIFSLKDLVEVETREKYAIKMEKNKKYTYYNSTNYAFQLDFTDLETGKNYVLGDNGLLYW